MGLSANIKPWVQELVPEALKHLMEEADDEDARMKAESLKAEALKTEDAEVIVIDDDDEKTSFAKPVQVNDDQPRVLIIDQLTKVHSLYATNGTGKFTGETLYRAVFGDLIKMLRDSNTFDVIIVNCDNPKGVPKQKFEEQGRRSEQQIANAARIEDEGGECYQAYDPSMLIKEGGLQKPNTPADTERGITHPIEPFFANRIWPSRQLRIKVWRYMSNRLQREFFASGKLLIFNYEHEGPHFFDANGWRQRKDLYHNLGESDLALQFWCFFFRQRRIVLETIDSDVMPSIIGWLDQLPDAERPRQILWMYKETITTEKSKRQAAEHRAAMARWRAQCKSLGVKGKDNLVDKPVAERKSKPVKKKVFCNLTMLWRRMAAKDKEPLMPSPNEFILTCILDGNDFQSKKWLSYYMSTDLIFQAVRMSGLAHRVMQNDAAIKDYVRALFALKIGRNKDFQHAQLRQTQNSWSQSTIQELIPQYASQCKWPSKDEFDKGLEMIRFNLHYWCKSIDEQCRKIEDQSPIEPPVSAPINPADLPLI